MRSPSNPFRIVWLALLGLLLGFLACVTARELFPSGAEEPLDFERAALEPFELFPGTDELRLGQVDLPAGTVPGFDLAFRGDNRQRYDPAVWLSRELEGVRFTGAGRDLTHIVAGEDTYHDSTIFVGPFDGVLWLEHMTIHAAKRKAIHFGLATRDADAKGELVDVSPIRPRFRLVLRDVRIVADPARSVIFTGTDGAMVPAGTVVVRPDGVRFWTTTTGTIAGGKATILVRPAIDDEESVTVALRLEHAPAGVSGAQGIQNSAVWGTFSYQGDLDFRDVVYDFARGAEHAHYSHGYASRGSSWVDVQINASGSEGSKHTARPAECHDVPGALLYFKRCSALRWDQEWGWRGGAGWTFQGIGGRTNVRAEDCVFWGAPRSAVPGNPHCLMVDDGGQDYYDDQGRPGGPGPATGDVVLRRCGFRSVGDADYDPFLRVGTLRAWMPNAAVARSLTITDSAAYGWHVLAQVGGVTEGVRIRRCNTPAIRALAAARGYPVQDEAQLALQGEGLRPFSKGYP